MLSPTKARLFLVGTAMLFSTSGWAIKALSLSSWQIGGFRSLLAGLTVALLIPGARRGWSFKTLAVGCVYAGSMTTFVVANKLTTAANVIFLQSAAPLYILLLGPLLLRERVTRADILTMVMILFGMTLFFVDAGTVQASAPNPTLGNILAVVSGVFWGLTVMGLRWSTRGEDPDSATGAAVIAGNLITSCICLSLAFPIERFTGVDFSVILYLGTFQVGLAYYLMTRAISRVPALEASLILNIEPALNPLWVWIGVGERPGPYAVGGGLIILAATMLKPWLSSRSSRSSVVSNTPAQH